MPVGPINRPALENPISASGGHDKYIIVEPGSREVGD